MSYGNDRSRAEKAMEDLACTYRLKAGEAYAKGADAAAKEYRDAATACAAVLAGLAQLPALHDTGPTKRTSTNPYGRAHATDG